MRLLKAVLSRGARRNTNVGSGRLEEGEKLNLLSEACEIIGYWRGRLGLSAEEIVFYGEYSGLAYQEFGDLWEGLFHDGKRLTEIALKLGMGYHEIEEACKKTFASNRNAIASRQ